jgi:mannosyl-oligosaccharide alpha-1,2-mannosidase
LLASNTGRTDCLQADRTESYLINPNPAPIYPGLVGSELDVETGNYLTFDFGWKSGIDSFLEYLIKTYYYNPADSTAEAYKDFWATAAHSTLEHIALHPYDRPDLTFISEGDVAGNLAWQMDDYVSSSVVIISVC